MPTTSPRPSGRLLQPEVLTILGTYKCTAQCENCCFDSNPFLTDRLTLAEIQAFITEAAQYQTCDLVVFSGGECFLLGDDLIAAVELATSLGMATRCVTNGYWAKNLTHGRSRLEPLIRAGLKELNLSTGDYHQKWVGQQTVVNAACLSVDLGLSTAIMVELQRERRVTAANLISDPRIKERLERTEPGLKIIESPWMPMDHKEIIEQPPDRMLSRKTVHLRGGCTSVLATVVITPQRRFGFCCGLAREKIPELNADWEPGAFGDLVMAGGSDFLKIWLWVDGPERILAWAATKDPRIEWEGRYSHPCQTCLALFSDELVRDVIRKHHRERVDDVLMRYALQLREQQGLDTHLTPETI